MTPLAVSALALLAERPMHPYEMYQLLLERHEDRFVKIRPGSLYHAVQRLEAERLVEATGTDRDGNRPERTTYAITAGGRVAMTERIREILQRPVREYPHLPLALAEAHNVPAEQVAADLRQYLAALDDDIAELADVLRAARGRGKPETYLVGGDYLLTMTTAQRDWIALLITRIDTEDFAWQPHLA
ncbi:PadR family transcriptional regulator [Nocardioides dongxiaopingii]|nr:PadR family transcriptional regulator [Nocardioides sp. S-1144]